jgi:hypothetical protein
MTDVEQRGNDKIGATLRIVAFSLFEHSGFIRHSSFGFSSLVSPSLTGITHWRQAFAKVRLLTFGFPLLVRVARLLFGAWPWGGTAEQCDKEHRNEKCRGRELFHIKLRTAP